MDLYLVYKLRPKRTGFNMYAENTQPQLTFLALLPYLQCIILVFYIKDTVSFKSCKLMKIYYEVNFCKTFLQLVKSIISCFVYIIFFY